MIFFYLREYVSVFLPLFGDVFRYFRSNDTHIAENWDAKRSWIRILVLKSKCPKK